MAKYTAPFTPPAAPFVIDDVIPGWAPSTVSTLKAWYVADNASNALVSSQLNVIADKSGNSNTATAATTNDRAALIASGLNSRTVWRTASATPTGSFLISNNTLTNNVAGVTLALVVKPNNVSGGNDMNLFRMNTGTGTTARAMIGRDGATNFIYAGGRRLDANSFANVTNGADLGVAWMIIIGVFDYANARLTLSVNGTTYVNSSFQTAGNSDTTNSTSTGLTNRGLGYEATASATGDYAEAAMYQSALNDVARRKLEGYLAWQWGLQSSLPSDHPYKTVAP